MSGRPRARGWRSHAGLAISFGVLLPIALFAGGCSLIPRLGGRASAEPDTTGAGHEVRGAADSAAVAARGEALEIGTAVRDSTGLAGADSAMQGAGTSSDGSSPGSPAATGGAPADPRANPAVSIDLGAGERSRLAVETRRDLAEAEFVVRSVRRDHLDAAALDRLGAVEGLIEQARAAYASDDIESAARVARKARLLSLEVSERP